MNFIAKSQPIKAEKYEQHIEHVTVISRQCHKSWVTKIKYYPDIQYVMSSSLDGCIHIHDIDDLKYKEGKTFNLHQKGVNSFVYSP
jgi:WD40 repeat protein